VNFFKFEINTIVLLFFVIATIVAWAGFEFYHRQSNVDIPSDLQLQANTPLQSSFDSNTIKELYKSKDKFYEITPTATPTQ